MLIGLAFALVGARRARRAWYDGVTPGVGSSSVLGGLAVGGAISLFLYGTATDRTDTGPHPRGRAAVSERGEWRRSRRSAPR